MGPTDADGSDVVARVRFEEGEFPPGFEIPDLEAVVRDEGLKGEQPAVGREGDVGAKPEVGGEGGDFPTGRKIPDPQRPKLVPQPCGGREPAPVRRGGGVIERVRMRQGRDLAAGAQIPEPNGVVPAGGPDACPSGRMPSALTPLV